MKKTHVIYIFFMILCISIYLYALASRNHDAHMLNLNLLKSSLNNAVDSSISVIDLSDGTKNVYKTDQNDIKSFADSIKSTNIDSLNKYSYLYTVTYKANDVDNYFSIIDCGENALLLEYNKRMYLFNRNFFNRMLSGEKVSTSSIRPKSSPGAGAF